MADPVRQPIASMAGAGAYNRHSGLQHANLHSALPLWEEAVGTIAANSQGLVRIVDYGASQGRNSLLPMGTAIDLVRDHNGQRALEIIHTDLPSNDYTSLFGLLATESDSYLAGRRDVFPMAVGRSYFEQILPSDSVDLGWSSNALHWLSHNPVNVADHGWAVYSNSVLAREAVDDVLAQDLLNFLRARSRELRVGGRLVCQFMGRGGDRHGFEWMAGHFWATLLDLRREGLLDDDDTFMATSPSAGRSLEQLKAPFEQGLLPDLSVVHVSCVRSPDPFWDAYRETGDAEAFGFQWASMMCAANGPNFLAQIGRDRDPERLMKELRTRLATRLAADPQQSVSYLALLSIRKGS
ncbi:hypothetical protein [Novosphingobium sp. YAF33]|uniref:hypothetical protein n=1 Tax=Novosphingobium sp. YAF33 TaxID=3233082 RepID=UPI003F97AA06